MFPRIRNLSCGNGGHNIRNSAASLNKLKNIINSVRTIYHWVSLILMICLQNQCLVRVFCCLDRIDEADKLANETGDHAACYHMARNRLRIFHPDFLTVTLDRSQKSVTDKDTMNLLGISSKRFISSQGPLPTTMSFEYAKSMDLKISC